MQSVGFLELKAILDRIALLSNCRKTWPRVGCQRWQPCKAAHLIVMPLDLHPSMVALNAYQSAFVQELQYAGVDFLVIGGRAMQGHGIERETGDLDIFVSRSGDNPERLFPIIEKHNENPSPKLTLEWLRQPDKRVELENEGVDVITSIGALDFDLAAARSVKVSFGELTLSILGLPELIYSKLVSVARNTSPAKERDLKDLETLVTIWRERHNPSLNTDAP